MKLPTGAWPVRVAWMVLPITAGAALSGALADRSRDVQLTASIGAWTAWALVLVATLVPRTTTLTVVRVAGPAGLAAAIGVAVAGPFGGDDVVALVSTSVAALAALAPTTADAFVDGSSYGVERRFALRTPPSLFLGPLPLAWAAATVAPAASVLLLAAGWWPAIALAVGSAATARFAWRALHRLSRRWLVLVPAGVVVHDHLAVPEPVLLRRPTLRRLGPATQDAESGAVDLTLGAGGLIVELALRAPVDLHVAQGRRPPAKQDADRLLVAPLRPGAFLLEATKRRLPVD